MITPKISFKIKALHCLRAWHLFAVRYDKKVSLHELGRVFDNGRRLHLKVRHSSHAQSSWS